MAGRYAAVYLFNTELWGWESWTRDLRYGTRDSVNRRVVDPPRYFQLLSIADHRMRSGGLRMAESASSADPVGTQGTQGTCCRVSGALSCLCSFFVYLPNAKEMPPSPDWSILPHSLVLFI